MSLLFFKKVIKVKCYVISYRCHSILLSQVSYIAFIVLYAYVITMYFPKFDSNATLGGLSVVEIILYFWIFTIILEEIRQVGFFTLYCVLTLLVFTLHYLHTYTNEYRIYTNKWSALFMPQRRCLFEGGV